jgi:hypothetical protein
MLCRLRDGALFAVPLRHHVSVTAAGDAELIARGEPGEILVLSEGGDFAFLSKQEFDRMFETVPLPKGDPVTIERLDPPTPGVLDEMTLVALANLCRRPAKEEAPEPGSIQIQDPIARGVPYPVETAERPPAESHVSLLQRVREALAGSKVGLTRQELQDTLDQKGGRAGKVSMSLSYLKKHGDAFMTPENGKWRLTNQGLLTERNRRLELAGVKEEAAG